MFLVLLNLTLFFTVSKTAYARLYWIKPVPCHSPVLY